MPPGSQRGAEIKKAAVGGGLPTIVNYPIIEMYLGTLQPRDFPYLSLCFIAICKI